MPQNGNGNGYGWLANLLWVCHILNVLYVAVIWVFAILFIFESTGEANINKPETMQWLTLAESIVLVVNLIIGVFLSYNRGKNSWKKYKLFNGLYFAFLIFQAIIMVWIFVWQNNRADLFDSGIPILPDAYDKATVEAFNNYFAMLSMIVVIYGIFVLVGLLVIGWMKMPYKKSVEKTEKSEEKGSQTSNLKIGLMTKSRNR